MPIEQPMIVDPSSPPLPIEQPTVDCKEGPFGGVTAIQSTLEQVSKQKIDPVYFYCEPMGDIVIILLEEVPDSFGKLILPGTGGHGTMGVGYVLGAGPYAGKRSAATLAIGPICDKPEQLLYAHVIVGSSSGMALRVSILDRQYDSKVVMASCRDIKAIDWNPLTMKERAEAGTQDDDESPDE